MAKRYFGVIPPIITPVDERENVDEKASESFSGIVSTADCTAYLSPDQMANAWH